MNITYSLIFPIDNGVHKTLTHVQTQERHFYLLQSMEEKKMLYNARVNDMKLT